MKLTKADVVKILKEGAYDFGRHAEDRIAESIQANPHKILGRMAYWGKIEKGRTTRGPV